MSHPIWYRHHAVSVAVGAALVLIILGVLTGRGVLIALATPLLLSGLWSASERPSGTGRVHGEPVVPEQDQGTYLVMDANFDYSQIPQVGACRMRIGFPGAASCEILFEIDGAVTTEIKIRSVRTGTRQLFTLHYLPMSSTLGWFGSEAVVAAQEILVLPRVEPLPTLPTAPTVRGLTGPRQSRKLGEGYEFRDVALMASGDRARQIDWRVSARKSVELDQLYVRRNYAQAEATTMILVDSRDDVGTEIALWGSAHQARPDQLTSLDIARSAGVSLAKSALDAGDRVGVEDLGRPRNPVTPGTGARHFSRITHSLALARPLGAPSVRTRAPFVPAGALVYVLSTFLDETAFITIASLVRMGHTVVAIDTLPQTSTWSLLDRQLLAWRLVELDRQAQIALTENLGVTVVRWSDPDRDQTLAIMTRTRSARTTVNPKGGTSHGAK